MYMYSTCIEHMFLLNMYMYTSIIYSIRKKYMHVHVVIIEYMFHSDHTAVHVFQDMQLYMYCTIHIQYMYINVYCVFL